MIAEEIQQFYSEVLQDIHRQADAEERFAEDAFFEIFCDHLMDAGEVDEANRAHYFSARGVRIDGYGGAPSATDGTLSLIVADFSQSREVESLTATEMSALFRRARAFVERSLDSGFRNQLEESSAGFGLADLIASTWRSVAKIRLFLISNRMLSSRVDSLPEGEVDGIPVTLNVWDISRLYRYAMSGRSREEILVDLEEHGGVLPALPAHLEDVEYEAYLTVIPGVQLASIYDRWGARLLEQNVRVFLQARGNVNKGIKNTIEQKPEMFFAYNNGITATAEDVKIRSSPEGQVITHLRNLQIVNGGQTTASIAHARRNGADLSKVFVQVKLSIISPEHAEVVVPRISEYANSQNKVNAADFFANHPFHLRMQEFAQRTLAPSADGAIRESKWFYERARGQYQDARANLSLSARKKFDLEFPKAQVITKTDLAKFLVVWEQAPQIVSKGAQKNFAYFANEIGKRWADKPEGFNEAFYRESVAKAILFRAAERLVHRQDWYEGGYRANIVAYALAKLSHDIALAGNGIDFEAVWRAQKPSEGLEAALVIAAEAVKDVLVHPPPGRHNVTEWAKLDACWHQVAALEIDWPAALQTSLIDNEERQSRSRYAVQEQRMLSGIEAQTVVVNAGAPTWKAVKEWAAAKRLLSQKQLEILDVAAAMPRKLPSEKQSMVILDALQKLRAEGCPHAAEVRTVH